MASKLLSFMLMWLIGIVVAQLSLSIVNNFVGIAPINVYITGTDPNNDLVLLQSDGSWFRPQLSLQSSTPLQVPDSITIPISEQGTATAINLPGYLLSGRVWLAVNTLTFSTVLDANGQVALVEPSTNPSDQNAAGTWDFVELDYSEDGLFADISYVDFIGLALGLSLESEGNNIQVVLGLPANATTSICNNLKSVASIGQPWDQLCVTNSTNNIVRILSPNSYMNLYPTAFSDYYSEYVNTVWATYSSGPLIINTQASAGNVTCTATGDILACAGDNRNYSKPTAADIFSCSSGPFGTEASDNDIHQAVVPRLCAAFVRSTLLLSDGNVQPGPDSSYYTVTPTNYYSKFVHEYKLDGKGYAFPYDDVHLDGEDQSGLVAAQNPTLLTITVGGPSNV